MKIARECYLGLRIGTSTPPPRMRRRAREQMKLLEYIYALLDCATRDIDPGLRRDSPETQKRR